MVTASAYPELNCREAALAALEQSFAWPGGDASAFLIALHRLQQAPRLWSRSRVLAETDAREWLQFSSLFLIIGVCAVEAGHGGIEEMGNGDVEKNRHIRAENGPPFPRRPVMGRAWRTTVFALVACKGER